MGGSQGSVQHGSGRVQAEQLYCLLKSFYMNKWVSLDLQVNDTSEDHSLRLGIRMLPPSGQWLLTLEPLCSLTHRKSEKPVK